MLMIRAQVKDKMEISLVQLIKMMRDASAGLVHLHRYLLLALDLCYYYVIWMHSQLYSPKYCEVKLCVIATLLLAICWCVPSALCSHSPIYIPQTLPVQPTLESIPA